MDDKRNVSRKPKKFDCIADGCVGKPRGDVDAEGRHARAVFDFMHDLLMKMAVALESSPLESKMHATILIQSERNAPFSIFDQAPSGTFPHGEVFLDPTTSSAAICAAGVPNTILYIPKPRFVHGIKPAFTNANHADATSTEIVENAFQEIGPAKGQSLLQCFAAIQIPKETGVSARLIEQMHIGPNAQLVLCLGSRQGDVLGPLEFNVMLAVANLLGMAFQ
jgi:hypothetical protein